MVEGWVLANPEVFGTFRLHCCDWWSSLRCAVRLWRLQRETSNQNKLKIKLKTITKLMHVYIPDNPKLCIDELLLLKNLFPTQTEWQRLVFIQGYPKADSSDFFYLQHSLSHWVWLFNMQMICDCIIHSQLPV